MAWPLSTCSRSHALRDQSGPDLACSSEFRPFSAHRLADAIGAYEVRAGKPFEAVAHIGPAAQVDMPAEDRGRANVVRGCVRLLSCLLP